LIWFESSCNYNIPFTVGGGTVKDVDVLLQNGADKVSINSSAVKKPQLINDLAQNLEANVVVGN
jgi:cyclase